MIIWGGETLNRFYAVGLGETRSAANHLLQAKLCSDENMHLAVVRRMYARRFPGIVTDGMTLQQIRGMEGIRVKETYKLEAKRNGLKWSGRKYKQLEWDETDEINKALSSANAILYGICHSAIVSLGYSPGLGFIHSGKMLSFVYDIADLYKAETTIPAAFESVKEKSLRSLEEKIRRNMRQRIVKSGVLKRIAEDIAWIFDIPLSEIDSNYYEVGTLWDGDDIIPGGKNYGKDAKQ